MRISVEEVFETVRMTIEQNFDIRTVTLGVNLKDCMDRNPKAFNKRIYKRISEMGKRLNQCADELEQKYGIPITNRRISVTPAALLIEPMPRKISTAVSVAKTLDKAARAGISVRCLAAWESHFPRAARNALPIRVSIGAAARHTAHADDSSARGR